MIAFKNILVPVDFSEPSKKALRHALLLARQFNAGLVLAHIVPESPALMYAFPTRLGDIEIEQYKTAKQEIADLASAEKSANLNVRTIVKIGKVEEQLLEIVQNERIDLVVMGSQGRRRIARWLIGSVTEHMLRHVPVPVLTVSHIEPEEASAKEVSLKRILYATDLSESASVGLKYALEFARTAGAHVTVLHVLDDEDRMLWGPALITRLDRPQLLQEWRRELDDFVKKESPPGVSLEAVLLEGKPFHRILEFSESEHVDMIVMNLQSKSIVERALLGSTAERVVRLARVPVLSIPVAGDAHGS